MKKKIIVIDDKYEYRIFLKFILSENYEVKTVKDTLQAFSLILEGYLPNLIISNDINQTSKKYSLLDQLKLNKIYNTIPIIDLISFQKYRNKAELSKAVAGNYLDEIIIKYLTINLIG
jgi:DNA-binding NtrC family response regulator